MCRRSRPCEGEEEAAHGEHLDLYMLQRTSGPFGVRDHRLCRLGGSRGKRRRELPTGERLCVAACKRDGRMPGPGARAARHGGLRDGTTRTAHNARGEGDLPAGDAVRMKASDGHDDAAGLNSGDAL